MASISTEETLTLIASHLDAAKRLTLKADLDSASRAILRAEKWIRTISSATIPGTMDDAPDKAEIAAATARGDVTDSQHAIPGTQNTSPNKTEIADPIKRTPAKAGTGRPKCFGHFNGSPDSPCRKCAAVSECATSNIEVPELPTPTPVSRKPTRSITFIPKCLGYYDPSLESICKTCKRRDPCEQLKTRIANNSDFAIWWREASTKERVAHMKDIYQP